MSYDVDVYTKGFSSQLFPSIKGKLLELGLDCEFHPEAVKSTSLPSGFLPVRMKVMHSNTRQYADFAGDILTGFEMRVSKYDCDLEMNKSESAAPFEPRQSFVQRLLSGVGGGGTLASLTPGIVEKLKSCQQVVAITCGQKNASELRIALYFAVALAQLTDGVVRDSYKGTYMDASAAAEQLPKMVTDYERSLHGSSWSLQEFSGWH